MKLRFKILLLIALVAPSLYANEPTIVSDSKTFSKDVYPSKMQTTIKINASAKTFTTAKELAEEFNAVFKNKSVCNANSAFISPKYIYANNKQTQDGYAANINANCEFLDIKDYDKILNAIYDEAKSSKTQISTSPIVWVVADDVIESAQDALKADAIKYALAQSKILAGQLNMLCTIQTIKFATERMMPYPLMRAAQLDTLTPTQSPDIKEQKLNLNTQYSWGCVSE